MGRLEASIAELRTSIADLRTLSAKDGENIRALARIAEIHVRRISDLEGGGIVIAAHYLKRRPRPEYHP